MNKLLFPVAFAMLFIVAAAGSNTTFNRVGIAPGTQWSIDIYSATNISYNAFVVSTANFIAINSIPAVPFSNAYSYVAGYNGGSAFVYVDGSVNFNSNTTVNFIPTSNQVNPVYFSCNLGQSVCTPLTGNLTNVTQLQNHILGTPFSANLTIYINPAGYYEYIVQNQSNGKNAKLPESLYLNILPNQLINNAINLTIFGNQFKLFSVSKQNPITVVENSSNGNVITLNLTSANYQGAIFYSDLIDISPIENDMLGGNLTPQTFSNFIYSNINNFHNTTLVYNYGFSLSSVLGTTFQFSVNTFLSILTHAAYTVFPPLFALTGGTQAQGPHVSGLNTLNMSESSTPATSAIPIMLQNIPATSLSYPIYVSYAYPNLVCQARQLNLGICIESGQTGMLDFNNYIDEVYAPQLLMNTFLTIDATFIMGIALISLIVNKINGG